ncbi:MAG: hypothetical protein R6U32_07415 [Candidatus Woesearchaeota archaeon]
MKHKLSITMDESTVLALLEAIRGSKGCLRSKSHAVEVAVQRFLEREITIPLNRRAHDEPE